MPRYGANSYREIRGVLAPEYRDLPDESVEAIVQSSLGAVDTEALESFLGSLKKIGKSVAKIAPSVLPVVGTVAGTAFGGPIGATVGGTLGRAAGGAISAGAKGGGRAAGRSLLRSGRALGRQALTMAPGMMGAAGLPPGLATALPAGLSAVAGGQGSPAAQQLLSIINRPEIIQALMAMALGPAGRTHIPVGGGQPAAPGEPAEPPTPIPVGAIANVIGTLANQAGSDQNAADPQQGESVPSYLLGESGEFLVDPAVPEARAQLVLELLNSSLPESDESNNYRASFEDFEDFEDYEDFESDESDESDEADELYDMLELSEAYAEEY